MPFLLVPLLSQLKTSPRRVRWRCLWKFSADRALCCFPFSFVLLYLPSSSSLPFNKPLIPLHLTVCSFSEMNVVPVGVGGMLQERFLSLLIFLLCSWAPPLKVMDVGGWFREEPASAANCLATSGVSLYFLMSRMFPWAPA